MRVILIFIALMLATPSPASADKRVALVIGNAGYQHAAPLANPLNDAADVSAALKKLGFQVIEGRDLGKLGMDRLIVQFAHALTGADAGVLFYAGHGLQVDGQNYLVPIDAKLESAAGLEFETVRLDAVHKTMERATRTNILFIDACRDNPLSRNLARALGTRSATIGRGLAAVEAGEGTLISFSTQPGNVALDGVGRNSPYATALVRQLGTPKEDISTLLIGVRNEVIRETRRKQVPWEHSALTARFFFTPPKPDKPMVAPPQPVGLSYAQRAELAFWATVKDSRDPGVIQTYLDAYPQGTFAGLARVLIDRTKAESERKEAVKAAEAARNAQEEAAAQQLAEEERQKRAAEIEVERRAEQELQRLAAEAEARRRAKEERRLAEEAEQRRREAARRKAEEDDRLAAAEAHRKAEALRAREPEAARLRALRPAEKQPQPRKDVACVQRGGNWESCSIARAACKGSSSGVASICDAAFYECKGTGKWIYRHSGGCSDWGPVQKR